MGATLTGTDTGRSGVVLNADKLDIAASAFLGAAPLRLQHAGASLWQSAPGLKPNCASEAPQCKGGNGDWLGGERGELRFSEHRDLIFCHMQRGASMVLNDGFAFV